MTPTILSLCGGVLSALLTCAVLWSIAKEEERVAAEVTALYDLWDGEGQR